MPPPVPASPVAPISAEARLAYVLQHFRQAYHIAAPLPFIAYSPLGPEDAPLVIRVSGADDFFSGCEPYPPSHRVSWRPWLGKDVPFFFDNKPQAAPLLLEENGRALIQADIISGAFYLLSGWQEYFSTERDRHGRFPYSASVQCRYGFATVPVVNYYFDILRTAVEHVTGQRVTPRIWNNQQPFAAFITHDIDNCRSAWKAAGKPLLRGGKIGRFLRLLAQRALGRDAWDNLETVQAETAGLGAKSTFFFLGNHQSAPNGTPNADYDLTKPGFQQRIRRLAANGAEINLHGSLGTATDAQRLRQEQAQLPAAGHGNRFHYLSWEPRLTPAVLAAAGVAYDSTLGFAEQFGFRNSYCLPFRPFDFERGRAHDFLEVPLNVMDATLHHPSYLQLQPDEILPALLPMLEEIERFGGVCTVLWHNENFDPANRFTGPQQFRQLLTYLRSRGAAFVNGADLVAGFAPEAAPQRTTDN